MDTHLLFCSDWPHNTSFLEYIDILTTCDLWGILQNVKIIVDLRDLLVVEAIQL